MKFLLCKGEVCGYVARADTPFLTPVGSKAIKVSRRYVIAGIGDIELVRIGVDSFAVGHLDSPFRIVRDKATGDDIPASGIDNGIAESPRIGDVAPFRSVDIEGVARQGHFGVRHVESIANGIGTRVDDVGLGMYTIVVASR